MSPSLRSRRALSGDRSFRVVERRRTGQEFVQAFGDAGFSLEVTDDLHIIHGEAIREASDKAGASKT